MPRLVIQNKIRKSTKEVKKVFTLTLSNNVEYLYILRSGLTMNCVFRLDKACADLHIVIGASKLLFHLKGYKSVVDGVAHGGLDGPAAVGTRWVVIGEVHTLNPSPAPIGNQHTLANYRRKASADEHQINNMRQEKLCNFKNLDNILNTSGILP